MGNNQNESSRVHLKKLWARFEINHCILIWVRQESVGSKLVEMTFSIS